MKEKGLREDEGKKKEKKSFRRSAGRLMDQVNGPSTPDMSSPDVRIPSSPAKHSLLLQSDANLKQTPTRESFACNVCVCVYSPQPDLFSNLRVSISFDFLLTSITDQQHVESSWFGSWAHRFRRPLSLLVCHVRQQRDRIATTRHPRQYHLLIDAAIETEHTPTAHY